MTCPEDEASVPPEGEAPEAADESADQAGDEPEDEAPEETSEEHHEDADGAVADGDAKEEQKAGKPKAGIDLTKVAAVAEPEVLATLNLRAAVEAVLFAADEPATPAQIAKAIGGVKPSTVKKALEDLASVYESTGSGLAAEELAGGWTILTREDYADMIRRLRKSTEGRKLSPAALETLAVVAYKQPVQRQQVEDIRGVGSGPMLRTLMERGLVKIAGRAEVLGRPLLYGTTKRFLDTFGLASIKDLPKAKELGTG